MKQVILYFIVLMTFPICSNAQTEDNDWWSYDKESKTLYVNKSVDNYYKNPYIVTTGISGANQQTLPLPPWYDIRTEIKKIVFSDEVSSIGLYAFMDMTSLESVVIPPTVKAIGDGAFLGCVSLKCFDIPDSLKSIECEVFESCYSLDSIVVPNGVEMIDSYAFNNCKNLRTVVLSSSLTWLRKQAFGGCDNIRSVRVKNIKPSDVNSYEECGLSVDSISLTVPYGTGRNYEKDKFWGRCKSIMECDETPNESIERSLMYAPIFWTFNNIQNRFYNVQVPIVPSEEVLHEFCAEIGIDTLSMAGVTAIGLGWLEYVQAKRETLDVEGCRRYACSDGDIFILDKLPTDFKEYIMGMEPYNLMIEDYCREYDGATGQMKYSKLIGSYVFVPAESIPYNGYYRVTAQSEAALPTVAFDIIHPMFPDRKYKISVVVAPNMENVTDTRPTYFQLQWFDAFADDKGDVKLLSKGRNIHNSTDNSNYWEAGGTKCDTITFVIEPTDIVQRHLIQLSSRVAQRQRINYTPDLRIAEIKVTPLAESNADDIIGHVLDNSNKVHSGVYSINGIQLEKVRKGLNLINGKKVLIR